MSKEFKNMDDLFRDAFAGEQADVPEFVKANIDKQIGFGKKRTGWIWFGGATVVALLGVTGVLLLNDQPAENVLADNNNTAHSDFHAASPESTSSSLNSSAEQPAVSTTTSTTELADATVSNSNTTASSQTQGGLQQSYSSGAHIQQHSSSSTTTGNDQTTRMNTSSSGETLSAATSSSSTGSSSNSATSGNTHSASYGNPSNGVFQRSSINIRDNEQNNLHQRLSLTQQPASVNQPFLSPFKSNTNLADANSIERGEDYDPWMISATAGVGFTHSNYTFPTAEEKTVYENSTFAVPGFEGGLDVKYRLKNSLTFGTGLAISELVENYSFFSKTTLIDSIPVYQYTPIYDSLDTTLIIGYDSTYVGTEIDSSDVTMYDENGTTRAQYLHIPFSIGTQLIYNKFRIDLFVQGRFNYLINGKGGYVQNGSFTEFSNSQNQIFRSWYIDLMLGTAVHYQLTDHLYLTGMFRFHPALSQLYQNSTFNRTVRSYHAGIGLSINL